MARQGIPRSKVVSSGRLTSCGRGQVSKKKVTIRRLPLEPAYSLYSTDSEDQVATVHKGLDRCAALLNGILQAEKTESKSISSKVLKTSSFKTKPKLISGKNEVERRRHGRTSSAVTASAHRPAPVQKTILSSHSYPGVKGHPCCHGEQNPLVKSVEVPNVPLCPAEATAVTTATQWERVPSHTAPLACAAPAVSSGLPSAGLQTSTVFNCRLTTSTPTFSPQRPSSDHSEPCVSSCGQSCGMSDGETHRFTQDLAVAAMGPSARQTTLTAQLSPNQPGPSATTAPAVQQPAAPTAPSPLQSASAPPGSQVVHQSPCPHCGARAVGTVCLSVSGPPESGPLSRVCPTPVAEASQPSQAPVILPGSYPNGPWPSCADAQGSAPPSGESSEDGAGEEEEQDAVDTTPVRDTSCGAPHAWEKPSSPDRTARKAVTVKYLLGELKALLADQDDAAVRLIAEVEQSISPLHATVSRTNVQAEIALALQPLRSENVQLRRRLRILNQQLLERERAERQARPVDCDLELVSLQSLNLTLQTQLLETHNKLEEQQRDNARLQQAVRDKESDLQRSMEQCELETSRIRMDVSEALAEMKSCQCQLEASEREKAALSLSLQQRETEISRLQETVRDLQRSTASSLSERDTPTPGSQLTKHVLDHYESQQTGPGGSDRLSDSVKAYLQTLMASGSGSPPSKPQPSPQRASVLSTGHWRAEEASPRASGQRGCSPRGCSPRGSDMGGPPGQGTSRLSGGAAFVSLREMGRVQPAPTVSPGESPIPSRGGSADGQTGLTYLSRALEKLCVSNGPLLCDVTKVGVAQFKQTKEASTNPSEESQQVRRQLNMGEGPAYTGRLSTLDDTLSSCEVKTLASDWSINSWSTFNTRDEMNFQNGLAALDASIANLQRTLKADLKK